MPRHYTRRSTVSTRSTWIGLPWKSLQTRPSGPASLIVCAAQRDDGALHARHSAARFEGVPESAHGMDQHGACRVPLDLLPQPQNVDIHGAVGDCAILAPDRVQQLLAAENHTRTAHQEL